MRLHSSVAYKDHAAASDTERYDIFLLLLELALFMSTCNGIQLHAMLDHVILPP